MDIVLEKHYRFITTNIRSFKNETSSVVVNLPLNPLDVSSSKPRVMQVPIPNLSMRIAEKRTALEHCVKSSHLLALTCCELQRDELYRDIYSDHVQALINHVNTFINDTVEFDDQGASTTNILRYLMDESESCPVGISSKFIERLLSDSLCPWLPRYDKDSDPLSVAIEQKNDDAVRAILGYCARKAHSTHLAYATPVERSFVTLAEYYPGILREFFRQASYIPAGHTDFNEDYVTISSYDWRVQLRNFFSLITRGKIEPAVFKDYRSPVFTVHLPKRSSGSDTDNSKGKQPKMIVPQYDQNIYTVPFPSLLTSGSTFSELSGNNFFNNPLQLTVLYYKAMMITQVNRSIEVKSPQDLQNLYFDGIWKVLLVLDLLLGLSFIAFEAIQCYHEGSRRYFSLYFYRQSCWTV
ncbi:hypothetical protein BGW42_006953 [Actinomortierella wolfii]|nr:hypothetical protein BGW42_006953 [Actinomortierella wolfii]